MPVRLKPHTLKVRAVDVPYDDYGTAMVADHLPQETLVQGKCEPIGTDAAFQAFGVEATDTYRIMVDLEDSNLFQIGALVRVDALDIWCKVLAKPMRHGSLAITSHAQVLCQGTTPSGALLSGEGA